MQPCPTSVDVVLVNPLAGGEGAGDHVLKSGFHTPPEGLCYLAACLRREGFSAAIIDASSLGLSGSDVPRQILAAKPVIVGLSATTVSVDAAARIARAIKEANPSIVTVLGGPHATLLPFETLRTYPFFDYLVIGEGEATFVELTQTIAEGSRDVSGIAGLAIPTGEEITFTARRGFIENLDDLPLPAWDLLPDMRSTYRQSVARSHAQHSVGMLTSRGCNGRCNFCARAIFGNKLRAFSAGRVLELFGVLEKDFHMRGAVINDDNFVVFRKRLEEICRGLSRKRRKFLWSCFARVDQVDDDVCRLLYSGGCRSVSFGIESGSQTILDAMNKGVTLADAEAAVRAAHRAGLFTTGYFILGYPGETAATIDDTIEFAGKLPLDNVLYSYATPYPGTRFWEEAGGDGIDWNRFSQWQVTYVPEGMTRDELRRHSAKAMFHFYRRPRVWLRHAYRALREGLLGQYVREGFSVVKFTLSRSRNA